ncbi:ABC transporter ATP-binding protein [Pyrodictium delaneyi]|uniref:ABC transporter ATP-binding protein n=1 Tax=Pyrodictium delaneyi TaxID=1273541 RepID=UPI0018D0AAD6|nr:ABC transporter ATP-binding protein [Pyrodictium delaneyi]
MVFGAVLSVESLVKRYGTLVAVNGVSFQVKRGIHGLVGPNGAGKTTTMKCIVGLAVPDSGKILFHGYDLASSKGWRLRSLIGYVAEVPVFPGEYTVEELLIELGVLEGLSRLDAVKAARQVLEAVGLWELRSRRIRGLSKGERKRLHFAQALLQPRELYVLDEPFTGLDPEGVVSIRSLVADLSRETAVLLSSHLLREVEELASEVTVIYRGRVVYSGSVEELRRRLSVGVVVEAEVDDPGRAIEVLAARGYEVSRLGTGRRVAVHVGSRDDVPGVVEALVTGGVRVYTIIARNISLEEAYIRLVSGSRGEVLEGRAGRGRGTAA